MKRNELMDLPVGQWNGDVEVRAAGAICPMPNCGALAISYEAADSLNVYRRAVTANWDFVCSECGIEFMAPKGDLLFQSIPRDWLLSQVCRA